MDGTVVACGARTQEVAHLRVGSLADVSPLMHPRIAVSAVSSWTWTLRDDLAFWRSEEIDRVGLSLRKLEAADLRLAARLVRDAGLHVTNVVECGWLEPARRETWDATRVRWIEAIDALAQLAPWTLVLTTGPAGSLSFDAAAERLGEALAPVVAAAGDSGVTVAIENTNPLRLDLSFVTTLRDAVDLAEMLDVSVCAEIASCWSERALAACFERAGPRLAHAQVSDAVVGSLCTPDRAVPGDGDIPLERILRDLLRSGYGGALELELVGGRIEAEGYARAIRRGVEELARLLDVLDAR